MKNIALSIVLALVLTACSSGSSEVPVPTNVTSRFVGNFSSNNNLDRGSVTLDIVEDTTNQTVSGNIIFQADPAVASTTCLRNTTIDSGTNNGFNISITTASITNNIPGGFTIVTTETIPDNPNTEDVDESAVNISTRISATGIVGTQTRTLSNGTVIMEVTTENEEETVMGTVNIQLAISNGGNTLSGTYVTTGDICSNQTGTGELTLNRA